MARRRILVTGATDGIGLALVRRLSPRHDVVATGRRDIGAAMRLLPENARYIRADQSQPVEAAKAVGRGLLEIGWRQLDYAVLNAGIGWAGSPQEETAKSVRETVDVNLAGTVTLAHMMFPFLRPASGQLTLIGSIARRGAPQFATYAASKAGLYGLSRALAEEWRGKVRVQLLDPGPTMTDMHEKAGLKTGWTRQWFIRPDDMAAMIEAAIRAGTTPKTLSFLQYVSGASIFGRTIR
ncbi:MAG: short-chain dehydrogenase [Ahrensia sp.]|nr:short-chain dehydrogenase [Ahrensia sp.]